MNLSEVNWDLSAAGSWPLPVKTAAMIIICALVAGGWIYYDTMDQVDELQRVEKQEQELKNTFETKQKKAANLAAYKQQLFEMEETLGEMLRQLPNKSEVASLLVEVSQTGLASGLEFELFKPLGEIKQDFYAELPIDIRVVGSYKEFGLFVSGLAGLPRIVTIHNVNLNPAGAKMVMTATVKTYRYLSGEEVQAASGTPKRGRK